MKFLQVKKENPQQIPISRVSICNQKKELLVKFAIFQSEFQIYNTILTVWYSREIKQHNGNKYNCNFDMETRNRPPPLGEGRYMTGNSLVVKVL